MITKSTRQIDGAMQESSYTHDPKMRIWNRIVAAAATDEECRTLAEYIQNEFTNSRYDLLPKKILADERPTILSEKCSNKGQ